MKGAGMSFEDIARIYLPQFDQVQQIADEGVRK